MLARLQQATTLGLLTLALAWFAAFAWHARWGAAVLGALLLVGGYALFLGAEMLMLVATHGDDPAPRASPRQLLRAWWGEVINAPRVFCWRQPFRSRVEPDHLGAGVHGRVGLVLVHGFVCNRGFWNPWMAALRRQGVPFVALNLEPVFGDIDAYAPLIDAAVRRVAEATGRAPLVVAHSMGGLAVRRWWVSRGATAALAHVVTIGSPHAGTALARFAFSRNGEQMRRGGAWLAALARAEHEERGPAPYAGFTCFYSHCDNIVFPPSTATLPGADNRHVPGHAHVHLAFQPAVFSAVCERLAALSGAAAAEARPAHQAQ